MNKPQILAALAAANVQADESMTVAQLKELAAQHGISLARPRVSADREVEQPEDIKQQIAHKVEAGLTYEQAVEVINRQQEADEAAGL